MGPYNRRLGEGEGRGEQERVIAQVTRSLGNAFEAWHSVAENE